MPAIRRRYAAIEMTKATPFYKRAALLTLKS